MNFVMKKASIFFTMIVPDGYFTADLLLAIVFLRMAGFRGKLVRRDRLSITNDERANPKAILLNIGNEIDYAKANYDFSQSRRTGIALAMLHEFTDPVNEPVAKELAENLFYRVSELQIGNAGSTVVEMDCLEFSRIIPNFNNVDDGFKIALGVATAVLISHVATIRKELNVLV